MPNVRHVMGRLRICSSGFTLMSMSASARAQATTATQLSAVPAMKMPGTSQTAAATATAVTSKRTMKFMRVPFRACKLEA